VLDEVFQFSDIATPFVVGNGSHCPWRQGKRFSAPLTGIFFQKGIDEKRYIGDSFFQCRDIQRDNAETVIKILSEFSFADQFFQITMRSREYSGVYRDRFQGTDRFEFFFL